MKTPMQELFDELNELSNYHYAKGEYDVCQGIGESIEMVISFLEKEKHHIQMAFNDGRVTGAFKRVKNSQDYYNETYDNEKT